MRSILFGLAAVLVASATAPVSGAQAQASACFRLWEQRNSIYKLNGFCFKTARAISYFGNAGCRFDNEAAVPLSPYDRSVIANIQAQERALGCQD